MKIKLIILFLVIIFVGKGNDLDSLLKVLPEKDGYERAVTLDRIVKTYHPFDKKQRLDYALEYYDLAKRLKIDTLIDLSAFGLSIAYFYNAEMDSSIYYNEIALQGFIRSKDTTRISASLNNLGIFHSRKSSYEKAIEYYEIALDIQKARKDSSGMTKTLNNIGAIYNEWDKKQKAIEIFKESIEMHSKLSDTSGIFTAYRNLGVNYSALSGIKNIFNDFDLSYNELSRLLYGQDIGKNYSQEYVDTAMYYFNIAFKGFQSQNDTVSMAEIELDYASMYFFSVDYENLLIMLNRIISIFIQYDEYLPLSRALITKGVVLFRKNSNIESTEYIKQGMILAEEKGDLTVAQDAYAYLFSIYSYFKDYKNAFEYSVKFIDTSDSLFTEKSLQLLTEMEQKHESEKRETLLKLANRKAENLIQQRLILIFSIVFLVAIAFLLLHRFLYKKNIAKVLNEKNQELINLNAELKKSKLELEETNAQKDKFFSIIAHDLKSPFFGLMSLALLIKDAKEKNDEEELDELIQELNDTSSKIYSLIENLLTWSRTQTGKIEYNPVPIKIGYLFNDEIELARKNALTKKITLNTNFETFDSVINVDVNMINTVMRNLISNAVKFTPENGVVTVGNKIKGDKIEFYVKDSGVGISKENQEKLFKIDSSHTTRGTNNETGTGLGLNLCKEFIVKNGGEIGVKSEENKGAYFYFILYQHNDY